MVPSCPRPISKPSVSPHQGSRGRAPSPAVPTHSHLKATLSFGWQPVLGSLSLDCQILDNLSQPAPDTQRASLEKKKGAHHLPRCKAKVGNSLGLKTTLTGNEQAPGDQEPIAKAEAALGSEQRAWSGWQSSGHGQAGRGRMKGYKPQKWKRRAGEVAHWVACSQHAESPEFHLQHEPGLVALGRGRQEAQNKVILSNTVNWRPAWASWDPVSKINKQHR